VPRLTSVAVPWHGVALAALASLIELIAEDDGLPPSAV